MFRPYSLTSLAAWTAGSLAGNHAYYSTKEKQQPVVQQLADEFEKYRHYGGELNLTDWLEEKKANLSLTAQEVATRAMILKFRARKLSVNEQLEFMLTQLNIFVTSPQAKVILGNYDFCDNETLYPIWHAFYTQLCNEGLAHDRVSHENVLCESWTYLKLSPARHEDFAKFTIQRYQQATKLNQ